MPADYAINCGMQMDSRFNFLPFKRLLRLSIELGCLVFGLVAFGADEVSRAYDYRAFDTDKNLIVEGVITLRVGDTVQVKGDWKLQILDRNKLKKLGPQDGVGKIIGQLKDDTIFLNLNPDQYENNIFLDGKVTKANIFKINGKWGYYGFAGRVNEGTFEMVRREEPVK